MGDDEQTYPLEISRLPGSYNTGDRDHTVPVPVTWVRGGRLFHKDRREMPIFNAYVYSAKFVEDFDGSSTAYGWDRPDSDFAPAFLGYGNANLQKNLRPLESRHGQQAGLANAASPWQNLWHGHDFR